MDYKSFKPCYKWNTFNTVLEKRIVNVLFLVLNLVINGIPSILKSLIDAFNSKHNSFKPCYKWNTFNTPLGTADMHKLLLSFKPCYKWNTFNTLDLYKDIEFMVN